MASKVLLVCALALFVETTFGLYIRNPSEICECRSSCKSRSNGSGSVRAIGIGSFKGGKFVSGSSSNAESSSNSGSSCCSVCSSSEELTVNSGSSSSACSSNSAGSSSRSSSSGYITSNAGWGTSGGPFIVSCYGPIAPSGISVSAYSDLIGDVLVSGELPFLSAVAFEGAFQHAGTAPVAYGCGDGNVNIQQIIGAKPGSCGYIL